MIPKILHQVWVGPPMPAELETFCATWRQYHPEWEYRLWGEAEIDAFQLHNRALYDDAEKLAPGSAGQLRSDVVRYELLERIGGVYVDTDMECLHAIDPILHGIGCFAAWETTGKWVNNAVMGAMPGHLFLYDLVNELDRHARAHADGKARPNVLTGPQYLTARYLEGQMRQWVHVFPQAWFYPYLWNELARGREDFPGAYAVHHWANMRKRKGVPR